MGDDLDRMLACVGHRVMVPPVRGRRGTVRPTRTVRDRSAEVRAAECVAERADVTGPGVRLVTLVLYKVWSWARPTGTAYGALTVHGKS
ncbi:hypothetical protein GCM10018782_19400 [Streptomyces griseoaurantiacus]|nr:hypothetical protein GCM10018782_19400 [Streptomyces griseoaurantiacus]